MDTKPPDFIGCMHCGIEVTADNIGLTLSKLLHICKICINKPAGKKSAKRYYSQHENKGKKFLCPDCGHIHGGER